MVRFTFLRISIFSLVGFLFFNYTLYSQWNITTSKKNVTEIYDLLAFQKKSDFEKGYNFFGPMWGPSESVVSVGVVIKKQKRVKTVKGFSNERNVSFWELDLNKTIEVLYKDMILYVNSYITGFKGYEIYINDGNDWYKIKIPIYFSGYQLPKEFLLANFRNSSGKWFNPVESKITQILFALPNEKSNDDKKFVLGELKLCESNFKMIQAKGLLFHELSKDSLNYKKSYTNINFGNSYPNINLTLFRDLTSSDYWFNLKDSLGQKEAEEETIKLIGSIFKKYPFLEERKIQREFFFNQVDSIISTKNTFKEKINEFRRMTDWLSDGHFYIEFPSKRKKRGSVIVKEIRGRIEVVGVFNDSLSKKIPLGSKVIRVDNIDVEEYLSKLNVRKYGDDEKRRARAVSHLLYKFKEDSTSITFIHSGVEQIIYYKYSDKNKIPDNFRPIHGKYTQYVDWAYFRLNSWQIGDWIRFYNNKNNLEKSKGIIFDLRGNSGGVEMEALRIASCFIKEITVATQVTYTFDDFTKINASNIIRPNKFLELSHLKIMVLVDEKTACASELFITLLKRNSENVLLIGNKRTSGTFANAYNFYLPFNITIKNNVINKPYPPNKGIQFNGIEPDIYIPFYGYQDLFPYNDTVLNEALKLCKLL